MGEVVSGGTVRPLSRPRPPQRNGQSGIKESGHKLRKFDKKVFLAVER